MYFYYVSIFIRPCCCSIILTDSPRTLNSATVDYFSNAQPVTMRTDSLMATSPNLSHHHIESAEINAGICSTSHSIMEEVTDQSFSSHLAAAQSKMSIILEDRIRSIHLVGHMVKPASCNQINHTERKAESSIKKPLEQRLIKPCKP